MLNDPRFQLQGLGKKHRHLPASRRHHRLCLAARRIWHRMDGIADDDPEPLPQLPGTAEPRRLPGDLAARLAERGLALGVQRQMHRNQRSMPPTGAARRCARQRSGSARRAI